MLLAATWLRHGCRTSHAYCHAYPERHVHVFSNEGSHFTGRYSRQIPPPSKGVRQMNESRPITRHNTPIGIAPF